MSKTYLGKSGKVHGPFSGEKIAAMRANGELDRYHWIWDEGLSQWKPLELAPPSPYAQPEARGEWDWNRLQALCHDRDQLVDGRIANVTQTGCDVIVPMQEALWSVNKSLTLNLYDPVSRACRKVATELTQVLRQGDRLVLRMRWDAIPV